MRRIWHALKRNGVFLRILAFYMVGSMALLIVFSLVLTRLLTQKNMEAVVHQSADTMKQAYSTANFVLNDAYDACYNLYGTSELNRIMFGRGHSVEDELLVYTLFQNAAYINSCIDSIYVLNREEDRIYTTGGQVSTFGEFFDQQALTLYEFYNERSNVVFLPRSAQVEQGGEALQRNFITMIFARKDALSNIAGGMIVNIDQEKLHSLITAYISRPEEIYIITDSGSILSNSDPAKINTTIQGTEVYRRIMESKQTDLVFLESFGGQSSIVTCKKADKLFYFIHIVAVDHVYEQVLYIRSFTLLLCVVLVVVGLVLSLVFSRRIYRPIGALVTNLRGQIDAPAEEQPAMDEFDFLHNAYNTLSTEVQALMDDNQALAKVRTREALVRLLRGEYATEAECRRQLGDCGIALPHPHSLVAVMAFDGYAELLKTHSAQDVFLYKFAIQNVAGELLQPHGDVLFTDNGQGYVTLLVNLPHWDDDASAQLDAVFHQVRSIMQEHLRFTITTGVGTAVSSLAEIAQSYNQALTALGYRIVLDHAAVISYTAILPRQNLMPDYPQEQEDSLILAIRNRNEERMREELGQFFAKLAIANVDYINMSCSQLLIALNRMMKTLSVNRQFEATYNFRSFTIRMNDCEKLTEKRELLEGFCAHLIACRNLEMQGKKSELVEKIQAFMQMNYSNDALDIEDIAAYAEISVSHLRAIFKEATGSPPNEYLTDIRIGKARELLATTAFTTKEVATAVGYTNHRYFYSVFKSKAGHTPTDYRKLLQAETGEQPQ